VRQRNTKRGRQLRERSIMRRSRMVRFASDTFTNAYVADYYREFRVSLSKSLVSVSKFLSAIRPHYCFYVPLVLVPSLSCCSFGWSPELTHSGGSQRREHEAEGSVRRRGSTRQRGSAKQARGNQQAAGIRRVGTRVTTSSGNSVSRRGKQRARECGERARWRTF
jgi:hypothetical protein